jgi:cryptochrome
MYIVGIHNYVATLVRYISLHSNYFSILRRKRKPNLMQLTATMGFGSGSLMWFRKGIRIHDNPALEYASRGCSHLYPLFVIDPHYMKPDPNAFSPGSSRAGLNRINFLLQSLGDLDVNLKKIGSRLLIVKGDPYEVLIRCLKEVYKKKKIEFCCYCHCCC